MHARDLGEALKLIMKDRGWTQTRLASELGKDQPWVSRVSRGVYDPGTRAASRLLAKVGWELRITPKTEEDDPVKRREFVTGAASALLIPSSKTTPFHDPNYVDLLTRRMVQIHYDHGGDSQIRALINQARKIRAASVDGGRRLYSSASDFMRYGSYVFRQAGRADIGVRFATDALDLAQRAGDPDKQGSACFALGLATAFNGCDSNLSTSARSGGQAVMLANRGLRIPGIGEEPRAYLSGLLACGLAKVPGQERQARLAIDQALNIDAIPAIDQADVVGIAGNVFRDIGERREALKMLEHAVHLGGPHSQLLQALYLGDQIMITLDMREPSLAASLMNTLSYIVPLVDSKILSSQVGKILRTTTPWSAVPEIRDARERLQSVRTTPPPQAGYERS
jgi:transcriptional regulator with XRE-family HTH domain